MGSFLFSCGISNRVLTEGTPVSLFFVATPILDRDGFPAAADCFKTWQPENLIIKGIQDDYGYVNVAEDEKHKMLTIMVNAALNSAEKPSDNERHPSWKQYVDKKMQNYDKMSHNDIQEHFNEFLKVLHNNGIVYKSSVQRSVSRLKVAHVDQLVVDTTLETPLYCEHFYLKYKEENERSRYLVKNFDDYVDYLILKNRENFEECVNDEFSSLRMLSSGEKNYHSLLQDPYLSRNNRKSLDDIIKFAVTDRVEANMFNYFDLMGVKISPSEYASQDYSEIVSCNYRNAMSKVFEKQKANLLKDKVESAWENGETLTGESAENFELEDLLKDIRKLMKLPELIFQEDRLVVIPNAVGSEILEKYKKKPKP